MNTVTNALKVFSSVLVEEMCNKVADSYFLPMFIDAYNTYKRDDMCDDDCFMDVTDVQDIMSCMSRGMTCSMFYNLYTEYKNSGSKYFIYDEFHGVCKIKSNNDVAEEIKCVMPHIVRMVIDLYNDTFKDLYRIFISNNNLE